MFNGVERAHLLTYLYVFAIRMYMYIYIHIYILCIPILDHWTIFYFVLQEHGLRVVLLLLLLFLAGYSLKPNIALGAAEESTNKE